MALNWDPGPRQVEMVTSDDEYYFFVNDPTTSVPAVLEELRVGHGGVEYIREPNGALIAKYDGENIHLHHFDGLGSTVAMTDGAGSVSDIYDYDAWGNVTHTYGYTSDNPYQYIGRYGLLHALLPFDFQKHSRAGR